MRRALLLWSTAALAAGCDRGSGSPPTSAGADTRERPDSAAAATDDADGPAPSTTRGSVDPLPQEAHLASLRQITFGGENAEAYLSFDERRLVFQSTRDALACDQIFTMNLDGSATRMVSSGKGRTTCSYFLPNDQRILYASTHEAGDDCLAAQDRSHGYVWKLYDEFDIYTANVDGGDVRPLTRSPGYDAEATVSPTGDRIVFTSTRDGDPELYTMRVDGSEVTRLTHEPGYDGGAFFSRDGKRIVWRANHPQGEEERAKYEEILSLGLVRPTRLELMVMDADGSHARALTSNGKANFAPYWHPEGRRVIYASNAADPHGRNFDLWIVDIDAGEPQQVTFDAEFDGFPVFTSDGKRLIFASNRNNAREGDTNIFVAEWVD